MFLSGLNVSSMARRAARGPLALAVAAVIGLGAMPVTSSYAQGTKIGFVSTERILRDSKPAKAAQAKIEAEFKKRDQDLKKLADGLRAQAQKLDKDAPVLAEADRVKQQRHLQDAATGCVGQSQRSSVAVIALGSAQTATRRQRLPAARSATA